jgi:signal transduction histidine kinase
VTARHELSQRQLRSLLLLLVLLPLSPTVLMFRFMVGAVQNEQAAGDEREGDFYRHALAAATDALKNHFTTDGSGPKVTPQGLFEYYRREFDPAVKIRIAAAGGNALAGDASGSGDSIADEPVGKVLPGARVLLYAVPRSAAARADDQIHTFGWAVAGVAVANIMVSGAAAIVLHRQSRLRDMQSSALATVAHEMKNPLASMRVLTDTLLDIETPDPERSRSYLHLIAAENDRLVRLTENFLTLSRFENGSELPNSSPVEPELLARAAVKSLESRFKEAGIEPDITIEENLPAVTVNRESAVVVLVNLLDNALKYSDPGTPVALRVRASGSAVQFVVEDHGVGIPAEAQQRIFDRFFQVDQKLARTREGCGLGLHIARTIVEAHRGSLSVQSAVGRGSTFCVSLPATQIA